MEGKRLDNAMRCIRKPSMYLQCRESHLRSRESEHLWAKAEGEGLLGHPLMAAVLLPALLDMITTPTGNPHCGGLCDLAGAYLRTFHAASV